MTIADDTDKGKSPATPLLHVHERVLNALQARSLPALIRAGSEIFSSPLVLTDERYHRLGIWPQTVTGDKVFDHLLGEDILPLDLVHAYTEAYLSGREAAFEPFYVSDGPVGNYPRILAEVRSGPHALGHLGVILGEKALEPWHLDAVKILTRGLAVLLNPRMGPGGGGRQENPAYLLYDALDPSAPEDSRVRALRSLAARYAEPWRLLLINTSETTDLEVLAAAVTQDLASRYPELILIRIEDYMVAFEHRRSPEQLLRHVAAHLTDLGYTRQLLIPERQTSSAYRQALALGDLIFKNGVMPALTEHAEEGVLNFESLKAWPALMALARDPSAEAFVHPLLPVLAGHDKREGTAYYETLEVYCLTAFNRSKTAKDLHVHRNTLLYRLDRITESFHVDLEDPETLLHLTVSFSLRRLLQHKAAD